jgi:UDPglucose 6-dehydrogenase
MDGVNVDRLTQTLSIDPRIGKGFFQAGMPFGGPCFPRDVDAMSAFMKQHSHDDSIAASVKASNDGHYDFVMRSILAENPRSVGVLGLAFKAGTDVTVHSPSFELIRRLLDLGISVHAYDLAPNAVRAMASQPWGSRVAAATSLEDLFVLSDVVIVAVNDPRYANIQAGSRQGTKIIDPWGYLPQTMEGVIRPGRARTDLGLV